VLTLEERVGKLEYNQSKESSHHANVHERLDKLEHEKSILKKAKTFSGFSSARKNPQTLEERVSKVEYDQSKESSHHANVHERLDKIEHKYALNDMCKFFANHVNKIGEDISRNIA
jgi:tetrahydromethanopterin S-methyltransferase subunit G